MNDGKKVLFDPDFLKPYEASARVVEIVPNARETLELLALQ